MSLSGSVRTQTGYESDSPHLSLLNLRQRQWRVALFQKKKKKGPRRGQLSSVLLHALPSGLDLSSPAVEADLLHFSVRDSHNSMCKPKQCHCLAAITHTVQKNLQIHTKIHLLRLNPV